MAAAWFEIYENKMFQESLEQFVFNQENVARDDQDINARAREGRVIICIVLYLLILL